MSSPLRITSLQGPVATCLRGYQVAHALAVARDDVAALRLRVVQAEHHRHARVGAELAEEHLVRARVAGSP